MLRSDHVLGGVAIAAGAFLIAASFSVPVSALITTLSARFFPQVMGATAVVLGLVLVIRPRPDTAAAAVAPLVTLRLLGMVAVVGAYFLLFRLIDFRLGTAVFLLLAMLLLGARRPAELVVVPVVGAIGTWVIFRYGFSVLLPVWT